MSIPRVWNVISILSIPVQVPLHLEMQQVNTHGSRDMHGEWPFAGNVASIWVGTMKEPQDLRDLPNFGESCSPVWRANR